MSEKAWEIFHILQKWEKSGFVAITELCQAIEEESIQFFTFSCLGTYKRKEELKLDLFETFFFHRFHRKAEQLFMELNNVRAVEFFVILPDREPSRTWGWQNSQQELSGYCELMIGERANELPKFWKVVLWSYLESQIHKPVYEEVVKWARVEAHPLIIKEEVEHMQRFPEILTRRSAKETAISQIAAYAFEGAVLEQLFPKGILVQSEFPVERKDAMYIPLCKRALPIIHPFEF